MSTNYVDSFDRSRIHASLQQRKELDVKSLWDYPADLPRQTQRFSSLRLAPTCTALRRRCQGLR